MFEVKREEYVNKSFRLPAKLVQQMQQVAQQENVSLNRLVLLCCEYALAHMEQEQDREMAEV